MKITQVSASSISALATAIVLDLEKFREKGVLARSLELIKHGLDHLANSRIAGSDVVVQIGDSRVDERCQDGPGYSNAVDLVYTLLLVFLVFI